MSHLLLLLLSLLIPSIALCENGIAELKALTGDRPYLGFGNQEQAPEYFGSAMQRQVARNPSYGYAYPYGGDVFGQQAAYRRPWRSYGGGGYSSPFGAPMPMVGGVFGLVPSPIGGGAVPLGSAFGGGYYRGGGNEWT